MKKSSSKNSGGSTLNDDLRFAWSFIAILTALIAVGSIILGPYHYFIDLFSHFQLQYTLWGICLLLIGITIKIDYRILLFSTGIVLVYFVYMLHPFSLLATSAKNSSRPEIYYINSEYDNIETDKIVKQIAQFNPKVVAIVEANDEIIASVSKIYGPPIEREGAGAYSCVIFTKERYRAVGLKDWKVEYPICTTQIEDINYVLIHPHPPLNKLYFESQELYFSRIKNILDDFDSKNEPFLLLGDFNSTSYNWMFDKYFSDIHKINNYAWSIGNLNTLPIDHAMGNFDLDVRRAPRSSSDHAGLLVYFN